MLTISAFASLAQLGAGLALALTLFIEPIQFYERRYRQKLEGALKLISKNNPEKAQDRENEIWAKIVELNTNCRSAREMATFPMLLIKLGAGINFFVLVCSSLKPAYEISYGSSIWLLLILISPIIAGYCWISLIASLKIASLESGFS